MKRSSECNMYIVFFFSGKAQNVFGYFLDFDIAITLKIKLFIILNVLLEDIENVNMKLSFFRKRTNLFVSSTETNI